MSILSTIPTVDLHAELFRRANDNKTQQALHAIHLKIAADVARLCVVDLDYLLSRSRRAYLTYPRYMVMKVERALGWNLQEIADLFDYDHTAIMHGLQRHAVRCRTDEVYFNATHQLITKYATASCAR